MKHVVESRQGPNLDRPVDELMLEIHRYLGVVALFRELGHEPSWRAEVFPSTLVLRLQAWLEGCEPRVSAA